MPEIQAFRAWRYDSAKTGDLSKVLAPPYDVISEKGRAALYAASPYNVVRLILGKAEAGDNDSANKYTRAGQFLRDWKSSGVLRRDPAPALYVYVQDYPENGKTLTRIGFLAAMKIDERAVLRHENTLAAPKKDRLALLKEVETNLSPIFGLFEDKKAGVQKILKTTIKNNPAIDVTIEGVRHRVFAEQRPEALAQIVKDLKQKPMFIADGHHRFEVACQYKRWCEGRSKNSEAGWNYVMTYFSDCLHNPFTIYPTHRLLKRPPSLKDPARALAARGTVLAAKNLEGMLKKLTGPYRFGVYTKEKGFFVLALNKKFAPDPSASPVEKLDVAVLHREIVEPFFKIKSIEKSKAIDFTRDGREAVRRVGEGEFDAALFLRPTSLPEMILVSKKGLKMPQKSTYFYPKLLSGLAFHSFED
ncbi:MAG: DUF1015 domain-containing protein [Candidatus Omnitrophica bacterium]|nr:DUF1015 domain-containing protein [Candidatus Omnitrophota bacterium]